MSKVITFSTKFPSYHPKAGQPTYFVEKIYKAIDPERKINIWGRTDLSFIDKDILETCLPKYHTIREGHRFKAGDVFSPRIWSGRPYFSPQIRVVPNIKITHTIDFEFTGKPRDKDILINGIGKVSSSTMIEVATNDGLLHSDLYKWLRYPIPFDGQIICWNKDINY